MGMTPPGYDAEADFAATGDVRCDGCGARVTPRSLETLPAHGCTEAQRANRYLLSLIVQRRVFREPNGDVHIWYGNDRRDADTQDYVALSRLIFAGHVAPAGGGREVYYEVTDRALRA